jgi:Ca2+:H+ antiporter
MVSEEEEGDEEEEEEDVHKGSRSKVAAMEQDELDEEEEGPDKDEDPITLKDRQSLINVEHPFGLPIWKPALYKKSRSVTRYADEALHSVPSAQAERHLLPGNLFWLIFFGWWLALSCFTVSTLLYIIPQGGRRYSTLVFGLGWYVAWPFGKYVEGDVDEHNYFAEDEERPRDPDGPEPPTSSGVPLSEHSTITPRTVQQHSHTVSWNPITIPSENTSLIRPIPLPSKSYGATIWPSSNSTTDATKEAHEPADLLGKTCFWLFLITIITPLLLFACVACWGLVITIPMAKLNWALIKYLFERPTSIRFCAAPPAVVISSRSTEGITSEDGTHAPMQPPQFSVKHPRLSEGQQAPSSGSPTSTVLLCTYRAVGWKYYKYTIGGVNIMFVNLLPLVIFAIIDGFFLLKFVDEREKAGKHVPAILHIIASRALIFVVSLASVIPLSYFIGMAVASISAQSSIGMGAVINASFGSIIEILLYGILLTDGKGRLVEGSIVGSLLASILLMPGLSMCSGALKKKEQKFNAKSAGVTSMMLIMAFIGTLTPTLFYQTYGNVGTFYPSTLRLSLTRVLQSSNLFAAVAPILSMKAFAHRGNAIIAIMSIQIQWKIHSISPL